MLRAPVKAAVEAYRGFTTQSGSANWHRLFTSLRAAERPRLYAMWSGAGTIETARAITRQTGTRLGNGATTRLVRGPSLRGFRSSAWRRSGGGSSKPAEEKLSLSARLRKLSKEYGWAAVGVYLGLSVLDFPFCFLLVRVVGTDTIGQVEHFVVSKVSAVIPESVRKMWREQRQSLLGKRNDEQLGDGQIADEGDAAGAGWGVERAQERHKEEASLATQLALAYAIHKSFIFLRVPLTAAVTPKVVKMLRSWGWNIGRKSR